VKLFDGRIRRYISEIFLNIDDKPISDAETFIQKAIELDKQHGLLFELANDYAIYSELFKRKRDRSRSIEYLVKAIEIFKECGSDGWVQKYEKELSALQ